MIVIAYKAWKPYNPEPSHLVGRFCEGHAHLPEPDDEGVIFANQYFTEYDECDECNAGYWTDFVEDDRDFDE
jgi:hypothetical protein